MEIPSISYSVKRLARRGASESMVKIAGISAFDPANVSYLEGSGNYTIIHFCDGRKDTVPVSSLVAKQLPDLIRVHKSYAIAATGVGNIRWIGKLVNKRVLVVTMRNKVRIAVSRRKATELAPALAQRTGIVIE